MAPDLFQTPHYRFECLRWAWPSDPLINWKQVEDQFLALSPTDQDQCTRLAARYLHSCRRTSSPVVSPSQWIAGQGWTGFLEAERRAARRLEAKTTPVWVVEGTAAWTAWKRHRESMGRRMPSPESIRSERGYGWWFPASFPPDAEFLRSRQGNAS
jgi:hypothetical protein